MKMKAIIGVILFAVILLAFFTTSVQAWYNSTTPWSQSKHDSQHTGMSYSNSPSNNSTAWTHSNTGYGYPSALVVADGLVFVIKWDGSSYYVLDETTGARVLDQTSFLTGPIKAGGSAYYGGRLILVAGNWIYSSGSIFCVNATTGNQLWSYTTTPGQIESFPTVSGNRVYVGTTDNYTYCFDIETGAMKWSKALGGPIYSSPAIEGNLLCIGCNDGKVYAFDISGDQPVSLWNKTIGVAIKGSITIEGDKVYAPGDRNGQLYVLNKTNGDLIWSWAHSSTGSTLDATVGNGIVFVECSSVYGDGGIGLYALNANLPAGNYTYASSYLWKDDTVWNSPGMALADNKIFHINTNSYIVSARDPSTGAFLWTIDLGTWGLTAPVVADGHVFVAASNAVHCIGSAFPPVTNTYNLNVGGQTFIATAQTNSTMMNINTSNVTTAKNMSFTVESSRGTGMCNITLPNSMLGGPYSVTVGGQAPWSSSTTALNATHTAIYFTYNGTGKYTAEITGTTAYSALVAPVISVDKSAVDKGQTAHFSISTATSGGITPYSYMWLQKAPAGSFVNTGITSQTFDFAPDSSAALGTWSFELQVTDSASLPITVTSNTVSVTVNTVPTVIVSPSSWIMDIGQSKTFTANPSGGSGSYTSYQWYVGGTAQNGQTAATFSYSPSSAGSYSITATVTDSLGATSPQSSAAAVTVNSNPTVSVQPPTWNMDLGQSKTFTANTGGGTPPYSYVWSIDYVAQPGNNSSTFVFTPSTLGPHTVLVAVTDSVGGQVGSYSNVNVSSALVAPTASGSNSTITQGETLTLNVTALSSGKAPYSFQWLQKAPGDSGYSNITGATSSTYVFITSASTATGTWSFEVQVTDSASQPVTVTSNPVQVTLPAAIPEISSGIMLVLFVISLSTLALVLGSSKLRKQCK